MKYIQNINVFLLAFMTFTKVYCSETSTPENLEFPQHTTEKYIYNKSVVTQKHGTIYTAIFGKHPNGTSTTDITSEDLLSSRVTRKKTEIKTENGESIITTETWTSRNPSYITWVNGALVVYAIAGIVLGVTAINTAGNLAGSTINAAGNLAGNGAKAIGNMHAAAISSNYPHVNRRGLKILDAIHENIY